MTASVVIEEEITIRAATEADTGKLHSLLVELARAAGLKERIRSTPDDLQRLGFRDRPAFQALIAEQGGKPVGLSLFFYNFSSWRGELGVYVQDLYVSGELRGSGLGRRLIAETVRLGKAQGATHLRLSVDRSNIDAQDFYRRLGLRHSDQECIFQATGAAFDRLAR
ncbi:MAG: GNAT family N-acetyltransferase [Woeseiaceae bacterium]